MFLAFPRILLTILMLLIFINSAGERWEAWLNPSSTINKSLYFKKDWMRLGWKWKVSQQDCELSYWWCKSASFQFFNQVMIVCFGGYLLVDKLIDWPAISWCCSLLHFKTIYFVYYCGCSTVVVRTARDQEVVGLKLTRFWAVFLFSLFLYLYSKSLNRSLKEVQNYWFLKRCFAVQLVALCT